MKVAQELEKIADILGNGTFEYRGVTYTLDAEATHNNWHNANLEGKPLKKLVGHDGKGNTVVVWSHDCESVTHCLSLGLMKRQIHLKSRTRKPVVKKKKPSAKKKK